MKKTKLLAALLAAALAAGLTGCGARAGDGGGRPAPAPGEEAAVADRYEAEFTRLCRGLWNTVTPLAYTEEGFYALVNERAGQRALGAGVTAAYEGQYDLFESRLYFIGYDGRLRRLEEYRPAWTPEEGEGKRDLTSGASIEGLCVNGAGEPLALESCTASWVEGPAGLTEEDEEYWRHYQTETHFFLRRLDENGGELSRAELALDDCLYLNSGCVLDEEGHFLLSYTADSGGSFVLALAEDGSEAYRLKLDGYADSLVRLGDGQAAVLGDLPGGWGLQLIDSGAKRFGESFPLPSDAMGLIAGDEVCDFYYIGGSQFYGYDLKKGEARAVLNWLDCGIDGGSLYGAAVRPDGTVLAVENAWTGDEVTASLITLRQAPAGAAEEKQVLTLAVLGLDQDLQAAVAAFNRSSREARIQVLDYAESGGESGVGAIAVTEAGRADAAAGTGDSAGLTKLTTELLTGSAPDLLSLKGLPYNQLAAKGLLEDLYPWLDADGELRRSDYFPSVLGAMEAGGGLYQVCPYFSVKTAIGARSLVGERTGWTYEELYAALETLPEGSTIFSPGATRTDALSGCLSVSMDSLVDWAAGTCRFDSEEFMAMLAFAGRFPAQPPEGEGGGVQLLRAVTVSEFRSLPFQEAVFGGSGSASYVGYPTFDGSCGSAIVLEDGLAMSASCADKEAAWAFLRTFMTAEYQTSLYQLPVNRARFQETLARAMAPTYVLDRDGNYVLDSGGNPIRQAEAELDGIKIYPPDQEQADRLLALVEGCDKAVRPAADTVLGIVLEGAGGYFSGEKTAQEAAALIQSKVSLYMNEQR